MDFLWIYIREAHPDDGSQVQSNRDEGIILLTPQSLEQREDYANQAAEYLSIEYTSVIDTMDDHVEGLYAAWPLRLHLVDTDGRLVYVGGPGPSNYRPSELEDEIRQRLGLDGVTSVSAASFSNAPVVAPGSIASAFGVNLAAGTGVWSGLPVPMSLAGASLRITDSAGVEQPAGLFLASPNQINYLIPEDTTEGPATVAVSRGENAALMGPLLVSYVAPGLFAANADGQGVAAAYVHRVAADDSPTYQLVFRFDEAQGRNVPVPVDFGAETDQVFLILYGTGIRGATTVSVTVEGVNAEVRWFGRQSDQYPGLDQVNVLLPRNLAGRGTVNVVLTADEVSANVVTVTLGQ